MENQFGIRECLNNHPIVPVVNIASISQVAGTLAALESKNIRCIEITLRSGCAREAIEKAIVIKPKGFSVGVGTVVTPAQVDWCKELGVDFMVSPGVSNDLADAFEASEIPFIGGVMTPSEIITGMSRGWDTFKLFPFNIAGGTTALNSYAAVFSNVQFCPTGGIGVHNYEEVLALPNVISVGGSWVLKD